MGLTAINNHLNTSYYTCRKGANPRPDLVEVAPRTEWRMPKHPHKYQLCGTTVEAVWVVRETRRESERTGRSPQLSKNVRNTVCSTEPVQLYHVLLNELTMRNISKIRYEELNWKSGWSRPEMNLIRHLSAVLAGSVAFPIPSLDGG